MLRAGKMPARIAVKTEDLRDTLRRIGHQEIADVLTLVDVISAIHLVQSSFLDEPTLGLGAVLLNGWVNLR